MSNNSAFEEEEEEDTSNVGNRGNDENKKNDTFMIRRSDYKPQTFVDLVEDDVDDFVKPGGVLQEGRNPFAKKQKLVSPIQVAPSTTTSATSLSTTVEPPSQQFALEIVKYLMLHRKSSPQPGAPRFSSDAIKAMGELAHVFVQEATKRAKDEAEQDDESMGKVLKPIHLAKILPKLLLDF